jgi:hypothetical protein
MTHDDQCCSWDEDGNPEVCMGPPKDEPDCYGCGDSGVIPVDVNGEPVASYEDTAVGTANCPSCNPTPEQHAAGLAAAEAARAEYDRRVAAGEITYDDAPF